MADGKAHSMEEAGPRLDLGLLGPLRVGDGVRIPTRKGQALLAYLALPAGRPHRRDTLMALLWGERGEKQARHSLNQTLFSLRRALSDVLPDEVLHSVDGDSVMLDASRLDVDVAAFERLAAADDLDSLEKAAALYRGDLLEGLSLGELAFENWLAVERSRLREHALAVFARLAAHHERRGASDQAVQAAARLLALDPLQENAHRILMRMYLAQGRPAAALRQYELCAGVLKRELGVEPEAETRQLRNDILRRRQEHRAPPRESDQVAAEVPVAETDTGDRPRSAASPPALSGTAPSPVSRPAAPAASRAPTERKAVTVLYAEVCGGGHALDDPDPERMLDVLDPVLATLTETAVRFGGHVGHRENDSVTALFGAPVAQEDHVARACHAALAMREAVRERTRGHLDVRIGLHTGEVVVRPADADGQPQDVVGPVVQMASRVGRRLDPGTIALTQDMARRAQGFVRLDSLPSLTIAEARAPVALHALLGTTDLRTRWDLQVASGLSPFVGRTDELAALQGAWTRVRRGHGEVVAVVGDAGVGKSRLLHRFIQGVSGPDAAVLRTCATAQEQGAFLPVRWLLLDWLGIGEDSTRTAAAQRLDDALEDLDPALLPARSALAWLLDLPIEDAAWWQRDPMERRRLTLNAVSALLMACGRRQPLIVVVEDLHWADPETLALLDTVVQVLPLVPILLLTTYRPEFRDRWSGRSYYTYCRMTPLDRDLANEFLGRLMGEDDALRPLKAQLTDLTGGNPLFLEECVRTLRETGALSGEPGRYRLTGEVGTAMIPATVQDVIAARIDRLGGPAKTILQAASVLGHTLAFDLLQAVLALDEEVLRDGLTALQSAEFLYQTALFPQPEYVFRHALVRQVAYGSLPRARRATLHAGAATAIERLYGQRLGEMIEPLADHCEAGELWDKAARYRLQAAHKAKAQYGYDRAMRLAQRALEAAERAEGDDPALRSDLLVLLGDLWSLQGDPQAANAKYEQAMAVETDDQRRRRVANRRHRIREVVRNGGRVVWYEHGAGDETLVFVHPLIYGLATFQPLIEQLCQEFRIVTIDPRGVGASDPLPEGYTLDDHMLDVEAVIEACAPARPVIGIGISRGAKILLRLAATRPQACSRLILVGASAHAPSWLSEGEDFFDALEKGDIRWAMERFSKTIFSEPGVAELQKRFVEQCVALPPETVPRFFTRDRRLVLDDLMGQVTVPVLVAHGSDDRRIPLQTARDLAEALPNGALYVFEGRGHLPNFTATNEFCDMLRRFVSAGAVGGA